MMQNAIQQAAPSEAPKLMESNPTSKTIFFQDEVKVLKAYHLNFIHLM